MSFFPENYEIPSSGGNYFKLQQGDNKLRILSQPVMGTVGWQETSDGKRKPVRVRIGEEPQGEDPKHFWALVVYTPESGIAIWEVTQKTIQRDIESYAKDPECGDPREYSIKINKSGSGLNTKYNILPNPKTPLPPEIEKAFKSTPVNLDALFDDGDPFAPVSKPSAPAHAQEEEDVPF